MSATPVPLARAGGRVLARPLTALEDVPAFDRSAYDGYALRAAETATAAPERPVRLQVFSVLPAGAPGAGPLEPGTALRIMTGAPIPAGADAVVPFERCRMEPGAVWIPAPAAPGENIVRRGEDTPCGAVIAPAGTRIDAALAGCLAAQGVTEPVCYRIPTAGLVCVGSELVQPGEAPGPGQIRNTNGALLSAALQEQGLAVRDLGRCPDDAEAIAGIIRLGLAECDLLVLSGGVSAGDYDLTPAAMERAGVTILGRGAAFKPGMACAYGVREGKLVLALSGNPAAALTNLWAACLPALRKLCGLADYALQPLRLILPEGFAKPSPGMRLLRGRLDLSTGRALLRIDPAQGNAVLRSAVGANAVASLPAGSGPVPPGSEVEGFVIK